MKNALKQIGIIGITYIAFSIVMLFIGFALSFIGIKISEHFSLSAYEKYLIYGTMAIWGLIFMIFISRIEKINTQLIKKYPLNSQD